MTVTDHELLEQFTLESSQVAFTALVNKYLNLVYSAALRQVRSPQLAEEVSQTVFSQLACNAANLKQDTVLTAWLYQVTRHAAIDLVRREARRLTREQIALQMSELNDISTNWAHIEPLLDEAMQSLDQPERTAILLRFFENKSLREVGEALGASEDAAQKRVSRAVERLRKFLAKHKIAVSASTLVALVSANSVQAAPSGLAVTIAAGTALGSTTLSTSVAITKTIAMTTLQKILAAGLITGALVAGFYGAHHISTLQSQVQTLKQQQQSQQAALQNRVQQLQRQLAQATNAPAPSTETAKKNPNEVLKLRGEIGRLRQENVSLGSKSALSKVTANPESRKMLRDQQKLGMKAIYKEFANTAKLTPEQTEQLNDLLADHIMENVGNVTTVLRDKPGAEQMNALFAAQEAELNDKVQALLGQDGLAQYQDYTRTLLSTLSSQQFKAMLTGDDPEKAAKVKQLRDMMQEETQAALAQANLPADYQVVPILNFRNIASEADEANSIKLIEDIYQRTGSRAAAFLTADELAKFQEFKMLAINNSRTAIALNRSMMAPVGN